MAWVAFHFDGRRLCGEEIMCLGGVGWRRNVAEDNISSREMMEQERFQADKIFFDRRAILSLDRSGSKKNVRALEIIGWRRREAKIK